MSTPYPGSDGEDVPTKSAKYNIKQYRGLADSVAGFKDQVERDRKKAAAEKQRLEELLQQKEAQKRAQNKELSVQLRVAGRSYDQLLTATRELTEELRAEETRRIAEVEPLKSEIAQLKGKLSVIEKPWKDEVAKRDLKIVKLQEMIPPLEQKIREEKQKLPPVVEKFKAEIQMREEATQAVLAEIKQIQAENEVKLEEAAAELQQEKERSIAQIKPVREELAEVRAVLATATDPFKKEIKELKRRIKGLEEELAKVDYSPYDKKVEIKELGYSKLVRDFEVKESYNRDNVDRMREGFEATVAKMDKRLTEVMRESDQKIVPFQETIAKRDAEITSLKRRIEEQKANDIEARRREKESREELHKELKAAKEAVEIGHIELLRAKRQLEDAMDEMDGDGGPWRRMKMLEMKLENVTQQCQGIVAQRDKELTEKTNIISRLQERLSEEVRKLEELDKMWDKRVQIKEEGYQKVIAELSFAEGQIIQERELTAKKCREIKARERDIVRLKEEHTEELRLRLEDSEALEARIAALETEKATALQVFDEQIQRLEVDVHYWRSRHESDVKDLRVEIARRDRALRISEQELHKIRFDHDRARVSWENKERDLEVTIRNRDRHITSLKNEIEFLNDSWDVKYNNLTAAYEKLQKKYEEIMGPNGINEANRRVKDLKEEVIYLNNVIADLKEQIKKKLRRIRDLELDIDGVMKQTADILVEKERGIASMRGDIAALNKKLREQTELMERLLKEKDAEQVAIVESFAERIEELEQLCESMRFTERQELVDKIETWKDAYMRVCIQRDDIEEDLTGTIDIKDVQVLKMAEENNKVREEAVMKEAALHDRLADLEKEWKLKEIGWRMEKDELDKRYRLLEDQLAHAQHELKKQLLLANNKGDDDEKNALRELIKEKERNIAALEEGIPAIVEENRLLSQKTEAVGVDIDAIHESYRPKLEAKDKIIETMEREHNELKEILEVELYRAHEACRAIAESVKKFPNPFEIELTELRDKYAQMQAGMQKMQTENIQLREAFKDIEMSKDEEIKDLEKSLAMAAGLLKEVAALGVLGGMSQDNMDRLEDALGVDLDGDGKTGAVKVA